MPVLHAGVIASVQTIFSQALELPEGERAEYLVRACGGDTALRAQIESLLGVSDLLTTTALRQAAGASLLTTTAELLPIRLERYELTCRIGQGAFGVVYRATQHTPVHRTVAVKVLRPGLDGGQIVERFKAERQALAALDHANIARLFDAGNMPDGRPFFVMELLEGRPLTSYCDEHRLGVRERLALFLDVCAGVEHAHRRGILHRDLKPSNLLVAEHEGVRSVKVIDFGIARALGAEVPFGTLATEPGRLMGTPEYMSPEQMDGGPGDVDTRADVYGLGVLLYELLCGRLPFDSRLLRSARLSELRRTVCETQPPLPSRAWDGDAPGLAAAASHRGMQATELVELLKREIEWVPMRALRKSPGERYRGAAELADDVQNYLTGKPLLAGPDSAAYRARKFVQRHRSTVASAAAALLLLVAAIVGTSVGMVNARRERAAADHERQQTELQFADTLLVRGQYATDQSRFVDAWDALVRAREIHARFGKPTLPADFGLYSVLARAMPPVAVLESSQQGIPWLGYVDGGATLISSSESGFSGIEWDVASSRRRRAFPFRVVAMSLDGQTVYGLDAQQEIAAYGRVSLAPTVKFDHDAGDQFRSFAASPDGRWLVGCHTATWTSVWEARTGRRLGKFQFFSQHSRKAAFSPDGRFLTIAGSKTDGLPVVDTTTWKEVKRLAKQAQAPEDVVASSDGSRIAFGGWQRKPCVADAGSGKLIREFDAHKMEIWAVSFSPDGKWLVSAGGDAAVRVWDLSGGNRHRWTFGHSRAVEAIAFAPDSRHFATASIDGEIRVWDLEAPGPEFEAVRRTGTDAWEFPFSADDRLFVRVGDDNGPDTDVWDTVSRRRLYRLDVPGSIRAGEGHSFTTDGAQLFEVRDERQGPSQFISRLYRWDLKTGRGESVLVFDAPSRGFVFTRDGRRAVRFADGVGVQAWDLEHRRLLWQRVNAATKWQGAMSADGRYVAIRSAGESPIEIVRGNDGTIVRRLPAARNLRVSFVTGRPNELLWSNDLDERPHLLNIVNGEQAWVCGEQLRQRSNSYWFPTDDGSMVVIGDGERRFDFADMADGRVLFSVVLPKAVLRANLSPRLTRWAYEEATDLRIWVADLTFGPRLAGSEQLRPTNGIISGTASTKMVGAEHARSR